YSALGFGGLSTMQVLNRLVDGYRKDHKIEAELPELPTPEQHAEQKKKIPTSNSNGVIVKGESGMLVRFAHCCTPLPGDDIVGYITRGRGVSVHKANCQNLKDSGVEPDRLIEVEWESHDDAAYDADIRINCVNRNGLLAELSLYFASMNINVQAISAHPAKNKREMSIINLTITVKNTQQLDKVIRDLERKPDIDEVFRVTQ
ncbi:MAG: ACT domain-containing protein, partial [Clostridiales bacterium]|nr:ACT domain-containing protein [Clostridiales bacterium]